jgi:hypothetical protein
MEKMGNPTLRTLLILGATTVLRRARTGANVPAWITALLLARRPFKVVAVALANKMARIVWALLAKGGEYRKLGLAAKWRTPNPPLDEQELTGRAAAGRDKVQPTTMHPRDETPMRERPSDSPRLRARKSDQPLAPRTSSRPAVDDRAERPYI